MPCLGIYLTGKVRRSGRTERDSPPFASCSGTPGRVSTTGAVAVPSPPRSARRRGRAGTRAGRRPKAAPRCARRAAGPLGDRRCSGPPRPSGRRVPLGRGARGGGAGTAGRSAPAAQHGRTASTAPSRTSLHLERSTASPSVPATLLGGSCWGPNDLSEILSGPRG